MKKKIITILVPIALFGYIIFQGGCVKENFDTVPYVEVTSDLYTNTSITELKSLIPFNPATQSYYDSTFSIERRAIKSGFIETVKTRNNSNGVANTSLIVIEGYVTSSDSTGNFYEVFTIQDATGGIDVKVNTSDLYTIYRLKPGQKVKIKLNSLYFSYYRGTYQIGASIVEMGVPKLVGIPPALLPTFVERTGKRESLKPDTIRIDSINQRPSYALRYSQKLVCIKNVQFKDPNVPFTIPGVNTNLSLIDNAGNALVLRTSGFSTFARELVPANSGSITGVLSKYDATMQLFIRDLNDIKFTNTRNNITVPTVNKTIAALKAMCPTGSPYSLNITTNVVITGVISGDDESGNLYKQLNIQDETGGITLSINMAGLYPHYPVGTRVVINCNGLCIGNYGKVPQLGMPPYDYYVTRMEPNVFYSKVYKTESGVAITPIETTIDGITDNMVNKLVTIKGVQFTASDLGKSWTDPNTNTSRTLENAYGNKLIVRTSSYATFAVTPLPNGSGDITAILTKYNSDYQLAIRELNDVKLTKPRTVTNYLLNQDFSTTVKLAELSLTGWKNYNEAGSKKWRGNEYSNDKYAEMTSYLSGESSNIAWLITPAISLPTQGINALSFKCEWHHWVEGTKLEVFISTNYDGNNVTGATWTKLNARLPLYADGQYIWVNSGAIDLSAYSGQNANIAFKYTGSGTLSTGYNIDNVSILNVQ